MLTGIIHNLTYTSIIDTIKEKEKEKYSRNKYVSSIYLYFSYHRTDNPLLHYQALNPVFGLEPTVKLVFLS
jgi:hypothetical protein